MAASHTDAAHEIVIVCPECATPLHGTYCHACGARPVDHHEYTMRHFFSHVLHEVTHFDSKLLGTLRVFITKPGLMVADYLAGRRKRYVPPLRLFLIAFAIHLFLYTGFKTTAVYDASFISHNDRTGSVERILEKIANKRHVPKETIEEQLNSRWHTGATWLQFGDVFVFAACVAVLFYTRNRYFVEHLIFSLNMMTFTLALTIITWFYYVLRGGIVDRVPVFSVTSIAALIYLFSAARRVYGGTTGPLLVRAALMVVAIQASRMVFIVVTFFIAFISVIPR
jgi:hypothetical protein